MICQQIEDLGKITVDVRFMPFPSIRGFWLSTNRTSLYLLTTLNKILFI